MTIEYNLPKKMLLISICELIFDQGSFMNVVVDNTISYRIGITINH
jgi:hypothetical protein